MSIASTQPGFSFDAGTLFGSPSAELLPTASPGEIVINVPEGISPLSLRQSAVGKEYIRQDVTWYDTYPWANEAIPEGVYRLRLPVANSNGKTFEEQKAMFRDGEEAAPLVLVELALLCLKKAGQPDPLHGGCVRCREITDSSLRVYVGDFDSDGFFVNRYWVDFRYGYLGLASSVPPRKVS